MTRDRAKDLETRMPSVVSERAKIVIMGVMLGGLILAFVFPDDSPGSMNSTSPSAPTTIDLSAFTPDEEIVAGIKDATPTDRSDYSIAAWQHLMAMSYNIGPAQSNALLKRDCAIEVETLRKDPQRHRGQFLWVSGALKFLQPKRGMHPIPRKTAYEGLLVTASGHPVRFFVSHPLPPNLEEKDPWIRVEGYFLKISDVYNSEPDPDVLGAPMLIGPRVHKAYRSWKPVHKLDPKILAGVRNGVWSKRTHSWHNADDMQLRLEDSMDVPLWHLASHALQVVKDASEAKAATPGDSEGADATAKQHGMPLETREQYERFKDGTLKQGHATRVRGTYIMHRTIAAGANPVGIEHWTELWVQVPRLGGKMFPVWLPRKVGEWTFGEHIDIDAFFFKNYDYLVQAGDRKHTPLFVSGEVSRYTVAEDPSITWARGAFVAFVLVIIVLIAMMARRARRDSQTYKEGVIARRRKRRTA